MENTDHQIAIVAAARRRGWNPANLSPSQYRMLSLQVRAAGELVSDAASAVLSRGLTSVRLRVVSKVTAEQNAAVCRTNECGKYRRFANGEEACDACNCSGKWLQSKWRDASEACPLGKWTNADKKVTAGGDTQLNSNGDIQVVGTGQKGEVAKP